MAPACVRVGGWPEEWRLQLWQIAAGAVPHLINLSGPNSQER